MNEEYAVPYATSPLPTQPASPPASETAPSSAGEAPTAPGPVLRTVNFDQKGSVMKRPLLPLLGAAVAIAAGIATGYGGARLQAKTSGSFGGAPLQQVAGSNVNAGDIFGSPDEKTFKDSAEGYLEAGGLDGEGSHKLLRPGGDSQTVYLTSSVTDLSKFEGMSIKVWGETFKAQKAGWLMDVGRVQVINPQGQPPAEE